MRSLESIIEANNRPANEPAYDTSFCYDAVRDKEFDMRYKARAILREVIANGRSPVYVRED